MRLPIQSMQSVRVRPVPAESEHWYRTIIVDFSADEELVVKIPRETDLIGEHEEEDDAVPAPPTVGDEDEEEYLPSPVFERGTRLEVEISFPDGIRRFMSHVRRMELKYGGAMRIEWPTEGTRIQRRDYVRVEVGFRATVWYRIADGSLQKQTGATMDISAGGVRLKLPQRLESGQRIEIEVDSPVLKGRSLQGRIVHVGEMEEVRGKPPQYWVAVEFVGVGESLRKEMTQMVFDIQRDQMKRSLG